MLRIALLATALGSTSAFVVTAPVHQRLAAARGPVAFDLRMVETETKDKAGAKPADVPDECEVPPEKNMLQQIKDLGAAGAVSYALWELGFWAMSIPIGEFGFYEMVGRLPDLSDPDDMAKLGAEAFAFVNLARFAVPVRLGLAISTAPWIKDNIIDKYFPPKEPDC